MTPSLFYCLLPFIIYQKISFVNCKHIKKALGILKVHSISSAFYILFYIAHKLLGGVYHIGCKGSADRLGKLCG